MNVNPFASRTSERDLLFAEAQALLDDGLDLEFVLQLYPEDRTWLEPLLDTSSFVINATRAEEPSFYFEASLKRRFIEAGERRAVEGRVPLREPVAAEPNPGFGFVRTLSASFAVVSSAAALGVIMLGFATAGSAGPGDWNYAFKLAGDRVEYTFATNEQRVSIDLRHKQERVYEVQQKLVSGRASERDIQRLKEDLQEMAAIGEQSPLDAGQRASLRAAGESSVEVLNTARERHPELVPQIEDTIAVAASLGGGVTAVSEPEPTAEPTSDPAAATATETETREPAATAEATPAVETPVATPTREPSATPTQTAETPTSEPSETPSPNPSETASETRAPTGEPTADDGDDEDNDTIDLPDPVVVE